MNIYLLPMSQNGRRFYLSLNRLGTIASSLIKFALLFLLAVFVYSCSKHHIETAGGAYAYSPDGKWMAEISDGYSKTHKLPYAVIELWDLKKYPSMKDGIRWDAGKAPTVQFEFPQRFYARDSDCSISWETNSLGFSVKFSSASGSSTSGTTNMCRFRYDLLTDTFSLERAKR